MLSRQNGTGVEASVPFYCMLTVLAESKTMGSIQNPVDEREFEMHKPVLEEQADILMAGMASMSPSNIAEKLGISGALAVKAHTLAYDFPHKLTGYKAINAFTGEAYRGLDINSLQEDSLKDIEDKLRIISSVYGILKPSDIIKPYRCEFNKGIAPGGKTPIQLFKSKNTIDLVNFVKERKVNDIIDLLPGDADKSIDWKIVRAYCKVHKVCFQAITAEGKLKTPIARRLKELRGNMTREILERGIDSFAELIKLETTDFIYSPNDSRPGLPVFITTE